jgi:pSer/pThr/pTyr-binding forkhead associated (FHA) protein
MAAPPGKTAPADDSATATIPVATPSPTGPALRIRVLNSVDEGQTFDLQAGDQIVGREEGSEIRLQDGRVSNSHALLRVGDSDLTIEDLHSTNGTKVNGMAIDRQTPLEPGDEIDAGGVQLVVERRPTTGSRGQRSRTKPPSDQ